MKKYKIRFLAQLGDFSGCNKNLIKISALNFAKIAFFTQVVIEGEIFSTGPKTRRPFSVSTNNPERKRRNENPSCPVHDAITGFKRM